MEMFGQNVKNALFAAATAGAIVVGMGVSPAAADPVILNPLATNGVLGALTGNAADSAFPTTQASLIFTSDLQITGAVNAVGTQSVSEVGSFLFTTWGGISTHGILQDYNVYGTFKFTGTGTWDTNGKFTETTPTSGTILLFADPNHAFGSAGSVSFTQASQSNFGVTLGTGDFLLASLTVNGFAAGGQPQATFAGGGPGVGNGQTLGALLALVPNAGTAGVGGFWQNVLPTGFNLDVSANATSTGQELTQVIGGGDGCPVAVCSTLLTHADFSINPPSNGTGSATFDVVTVPEPATLVLFGAGLLGLGFMVRRRN
jgi:hypothetical protein